MNLRWTTQRIAKILNLQGAFPDFELNEITTDSRAVKPGSLFVAIKGDHHDGHDFIDGAIKAGARAILSERPGTHSNGAFFHVPSCMTAIRTLAHAYRKEFKIPVIGIVGAVGKTTTKELLASILTGKFKSILKTDGSQNGFLGIPLTLLQLKPETEIAVIEIGIDEIGAMAQHLDLVEPTHVILTRTGPEHLHQLKTLEIAAEEELKAFDYALQNKIPIAINLSDPFVAGWVQNHASELEHHPHSTYSLLSSDHPEFLGQYSKESQDLTLIHASHREGFTCPLPGEHHAHNLLAAIVMSRFFEMNQTQVKTGLSSFKTAFGRTETHLLDRGCKLIGDYYNSNPTSLEAALKLLMDEPGAKEYHAVLGDMLELGDAEESFHRAIAGTLINRGVSKVWLYGPRMKWLQDELKKQNFSNTRHFETHQDLTDALLKDLSPDSRILLKGSRGMKMETVLKGLTQQAAAH